MPANAPRSSVLLHRIASPPSTTTFYTGQHHRQIHHHQQQQQQQPQQPQPHLFSPITPSIPDHNLIPETAFPYHTHTLSSHQTCSAVIQSINAPLETVWSIIRRFDNPQAYKQFIKSCDLVSNDRTPSEIGTLRLVHVVSGLPAATSTERLEILDDERHVFSFSVVGGDHRLSNYRSVTTLHKWVVDDKEGTVVVESYVVDTPTGNTNEETCVFVDTIVKCNLQSLANIAENLSRRNRKVNVTDAA